MTRWWQFGFLGGIILSLATAIKVVRAVVRGADDKADWGEAAGFAAAIFGMGFVCGIVVWAGRGLSRRFGPAGDAVVGLGVMEVFFVCCMLLFEPELLGSKFGQGGLPMLGLGVPLGLFAGWYIGRDFRPRQTAEQRPRRRFLKKRNDKPDTDRGQRRAWRCVCKSG